MVVILNNKVTSICSTSKTDIIELLFVCHKLFPLIYALTFALYIRTYYIYALLFRIITQYIILWLYIKNTVTKNDRHLKSENIDKFFITSIWDKNSVVFSIATFHFLLFIGMFVQQVHVYSPAQLKYWNILSTYTMLCLFSLIYKHSMTHVT